MPPTGLVARAARILGNIRDAISPGGRLIILESVMPPDNEYDHAKFRDVNMLVLTEGAGSAPKKSTECCSTKRDSHCSEQRHGREDATAPVRSEGRRCRHPRPARRAESGGQ